MIKAGQRAVWPPLPCFMKACQKYTSAMRQTHAGLAERRNLRFDNGRYEQTHAGLTERRVFDAG